MKTLILGSGAREHAIAWAFSRSKSNAGIYCLPGNTATAEFATNIHGNPENVKAVLKAAQFTGARMVVVGPEAPLASGVADVLRSAGIAVFGPGQQAAKLESSKLWAREFSDRAGVPSAATRCFTDYSAFNSWINALKMHKMVIKKSGLAAGKGVLESDNIDEICAFAKKVLVDDTILVEEFLQGYELSIFALCDGEDYLLLPACADHKKAYEDNQGPNTGGMGAICPVPSSDTDILSKIDAQIIAPTFRQLKKEGLMYRGVLFFGIMVTASGPKLLEYNVRFGDPETQSLLPLLSSDAIDLFWAAAGGHLSDLVPEFHNSSAVGITIAAPGYPGSYPEHIRVESLPAITDNALLFHAGTFRDVEGQIRTGGGRCFTAVGVGVDYFQAHARALKLAQAISFDGAWYRQDIGKQFCPV